MFTEYTILCKTQEDLGNEDFSTKFSYNHFRMAWYAFARLLDIDLSEGFMCTTCGDHPSVQSSWMQPSVRTSIPGRTSCAVP